MRNRLFGDSGLKNENFGNPKDLSFAEKKSNSSKNDDSFGSGELNDSFRDRMVKIETIEKKRIIDSQRVLGSSSGRMTFGKNSLKIQEENRLRDSMTFKGSSV